MEINLDGVQEYLTGISGYYGPVEGYVGLEGITSLTIHTNKGKHGPYGQESGGAGYVYFTSTTSSGKIVGFHRGMVIFLLQLVFIWSISEDDGRSIDLLLRFHFLMVIASIEFPTLRF